VTRQPRDELAVVASYRFPYEASLAKATLGAYGIEAWVLDETQIRLRWYMGLALGGVKVAVRGADLEASREILGGDHSADLASVPESRLPPAPEDLCPHCGAEALERVTGRTTRDVLRRMGLLFLALLGGGPTPGDSYASARRCRACGK
jgi:hypothetical protein